ncbi:MAG: TetR/AcrR family transcriptional regulator [Desulfovibrio sp.]|uniref:TetR/AcrR family transcriptional regulator n=1 Tax=Desulfovibrio sp. TaxID=885 RepID=UPI001A6C84C7|nr:TetR/AcrR family transcriptional regulator [Desulfovibrio sp.]MBD5416199.1 TetR/AcrR family transcriptional regulator [Desulfovibrio sp.]
MTEEPVAEKRSQRGRPREFDRELALRNALRLFWEQGYMQTTMSQLCRAMGIKSPSLYCAFGSKAELFLEALAFYKATYWGPVFARYLTEENLYEATKNLFAATARILLSPDAPCGCLTVFSALTLPAREERILATIADMRADTRQVFRERLKKAVRDREIPADTDIPAITGSLTNYFEGLTLQARERDICQAELLAIAVRGVKLLPPVMGVEEAKK